MAPGTEKPIVPQPADGTEQRLCKSNQTPDPVFAIIIDRPVIASDTTVKVFALQTVAPSNRT